MGKKIEKSGIRELFSPRDAVRTLKEFLAARRIPKKDRSADIQHIYTITRRKLLEKFLFGALGLYGGSLALDIFKYNNSPLSYVFALDTTVSTEDLSIKATRDYSPEYLGRFMEYLQDILQFVMKGHPDEQEIMTFFKAYAHPGIFPTSELAQKAYASEKSSILNADFFVTRAQQADATAVAVHHGPRITLMEINPGISSTWLSFFLAHKIKSLLLRQNLKEQYKNFVPKDSSLNFSDSAYLPSDMDVSSLSIPPNVTVHSYVEHSLEDLNAPREIESYLWLQNLIDYNTSGEFSERLFAILPQWEKDLVTGSFSNNTFQKQYSHLFHQKLDVLFDKVENERESAHRFYLYNVLLCLESTQTSKKTPAEQVKFLRWLSGDAQENP